MPTGAIKVDFVFSAANISTVITSWDVRNISMKTPWAMDVPFVRVVRALRGPGKMSRTTPPATMLAISWVGMKNRPRSQGSWPAAHMPSVTWRTGLN
jgi:hypothetical protein